MNGAPGSLEGALAAVSRRTRAALEACLAGTELGWRDAADLATVTGPDLHALCLVADHLRARQAGDVVTYVVNRNINFTNLCVNACRFCAFSRRPRSPEGFFLDPAQVIRLAREARDLGATEVCIQAGLAPGLDGRFYIDLIGALHAALPELHIHACSPEEVRYAARRARLSVRQLLAELRAAGLGSLPGTSAEILDDAVRQRLAPGRLSTAEWLEVVTTAHELGIPTTATMMYGHVETVAERVRHLDLLRRVQEDTGGFTEFVPLAFVFAGTPLYAGGAAPDVRPGPSGLDVLRLHALARLMLGPTFTNIQASWVKEGLGHAQQLLGCGVNDLGGTLMNESIAATAGATNGQLATPATLRRVIREAGRVPAQRSTTYEILRTFGADADDAPEPLDGIADPAATFGTYETLARAEARGPERRR